jgi:hypothetical protein
MNSIVRLYKLLSIVSGWIEGARIALLVRVYGIDKNEKPPVPWRKREGLPDPGQWAKQAPGRKPGRLLRACLVRGKVRQPSIQVRAETGKGIGVYTPTPEVDAAWGDEAWAKVTDVDVFEGVE